MIAHLMIRPEPAYRRVSFERGLRACGYEIAGTPRSGTSPSVEDVLVIWNRYQHYDQLARRFEGAGARVVVAENGPLGRDWRAWPWYAVTLKNPVACGVWPEGPASRWDELRVKICDWRKSGDEIIILEQRGIGPEGVRQPDGWARQALEQLAKRHAKVRIREHPGERVPRVTLEQDLERARCCVTWASGAAFKALLYGVPVFYGCAEWVGKTAANSLGAGDLQSSWPDRLPTFQRLAWSMWRTPEIEAGLPFRHLLGSGSGVSPSTPAPG